MLASILSNELSFTWHVRLALFNVESLVKLTFYKTGDSNAEIETLLSPEEPWPVVHYLILNIQLST